MSKLSLVIADNNSAFLNIFVTYLTNQHSHRFQVYCYSDKEKLENFFCKNNKEIDILLISPENYYEGLENEKIKSLVILSNGRMDKDFRKAKIINRFQSGDAIVGDLLKIFTEENSDLIDIYPGYNSTKVVGVFSTAGGSGKSSIAIASAITYSQMGNNVFYLNMENIPSTQMFFDCEGMSNLSHIFYHLKSKKSNIGLKIEALKTVDPIYNVNYFSTQESLMEQSEILPEEFESLILQMRNSKLYDIIFVDLPSIIDNKTLQILASCDEIYLVLTQDYFCCSKTQLFLNELSIIEQKNGSDYTSKLIFLLNKYKQDLSSPIDEADFYGSTISLKIPMVPQLLTMNSGRSKINLNNGFGDAINSLMQRYVNL